jgi:hypothetical protein
MAGAEKKAPHRFGSSFARRAPSRASPVLICFLFPRISLHASAASCSARRSPA